jgi:ribulose-5-phosphate 4-epimerase/fuculose-1-phosphate aldolase
MKIGFASDYNSPFLDELVGGLAEDLTSRGHEVLAGAPEAIPHDVRLVFNVTDARKPRANYHRPTSSHFICTVVETSAPSEELHRDAYGVLVRTMSNLVAYTVHSPGRPTSYLVTPELGFREVHHGPALVRRIADQVLAISDVRFVLENDLVEDLPRSLHDGNATTATLTRVGSRLETMGLLPAVLPLEEILSDRELRMLMKLFGIKQLSYGNLSARHDETTFWMTGRGVNKAELRKIGRDILLVTGFDEERRRIRISVPPGTDPGTRVSVDAVEHFKIYREFPEVSAILHLHAWLPGIQSTLQSYPCGTIELADEVLSLVRRAPDPADAVVGLRNHGITITGSDLESMLDRVEGRLVRQVPMV